MKYYKVLDAGGKCIYGNGSWFSPKKDKPGKWMPVVESLKMCESGYHLCRRKDLLGWLGPEIYEAEGRGKKLIGDDKVVFQQARLLRRLDTWTERTARLFACDCAERVVHLTNDQRSQDAIHVARRYAMGEATEEELDAAFDAARDAAGYAAFAAAFAAARAAVRDAAWDAAWYAARDKEIKWQTKRLFEYLDGRRK